MSLCWWPCCWPWWLSPARSERASSASASKGDSKLGWQQQLLRMDRIELLAAHQARRAAFSLRIFLTLDVVVRIIVEQQPVSMARWHRGEA